FPSSTLTVPLYVAVTTSSLPSPFRSPAASAFALGPEPYGPLMEKVPSPAPSKTFTLPSLLEVTRSGDLSPFTSATITDSGGVPFTFASAYGLLASSLKFTCPSPRKTLTLGAVVAVPEFESTTSRYVSPFRSAAATALAEGSTWNWEPMMKCPLELLYCTF